MKIVGRRVFLRPLTIKDAKRLKELLHHKIFSYFTHIPYPYYLKHATQFIKDQEKKRKKKTDYSFGVFLKKTNELIGGLAFHNLDYRDNTAIVGYWMGTDYHGKGYTTEASRLLLDFGFKKLKLHRLVIEMRLDNPASRRVAQKLGCKKEGIAREKIMIRGRYYDAYVYSVLKHEFRKNPNKRKTKSKRKKLKKKRKR